MLPLILGQGLDPILLEISETLSRVLVTISGLAILVFTISYLGFHTWRDTAAGRNFAYLMLSLLATYLLNVLGNLFDGDYLFRDLLRPMIYFAVACIFVRFVVLLWWGPKNELTILLERKNANKP